MTSVFPARGYGLQVTAADLWVKPDEDAVRVAEAGAADRVLPVLAEAHDPSFAEASCHAVVSVDAYPYCGTNDRYLPTLTRLLEPGGRIGAVVPSVREEIAGAEPPEHRTAPGTPGFGRASSWPGRHATRWSRRAPTGGACRGSPGRGTPHLAVRPRRASLRGRTPPAVSPR